MRLLARSDGVVDFPSEQQRTRAVQVRPIHSPLPHSRPCCLVRQTLSCPVRASGQDEIEVEWPDQTPQWRTLMLSLPGLSAPDDRLVPPSTSSRALYKCPQTE